MGPFKRLSFLTVALSVFGAALVVLAVVQKFTGNEAGSGLPEYLLLMFVGVLMGAIAALGSIVSTILNAQGAHLERLERRLSESDGQLEAVREGLRARVGGLERQLDESRAAVAARPKD